MALPNLQGFSSLPQLKAWGRKRPLRYLDPHDPTVPWDVSSDPHHDDPSTTIPDGFERMRMKLMTHLRDAADSLNLTAPQQPETTDDDGHDFPIKPEPQPRPTGVRRRRRTTTNRPRRRPSPPPPPPTRSLRSRSVACAEKLQQKARRFSLSLSREEIDEDFYALTGRRAPGRPKRRPRDVRKYVDLLFPGLCLAEITAGSYDVVLPRVPRCEE